MTKVVVYDKDHCPKCLHTEMQLKVRGVEFETKNIFDEENAHVLEWAIKRYLLLLPKQKIGMVSNQTSWQCWWNKWTY